MTGGEHPPVNAPVRERRLQGALVETVDALT